MFGGKIVSNNIEILTEKNTLLAVFTNQLYIFDLSETQILHKYSLSENQLKTWKYLENSNKIIAIDDQGHLIQATFNQGNRNKQVLFENINVLKKKITSNITDAAIVLSNSSTNYKLFFLQQNCLYEYQNGKKSILSNNVNSILFSSSEYIICRNQKNQNTINIIPLSQKKSKQLKYQHSCLITAVVANQENLIFGDLKGKIYQLKNYFRSQKPILSKLQWHVHNVNTLFLDQQYLYSAGEQGTVVMWHLRQSKRDFLPRIGTQVQKVFVIQGIVYCLLKDNSITSIDLGNDKIVKHYKTIINPLGFCTKGIKNNGSNGKRNFMKYSETNNRNLLIASSLPGSVQIINLNDASNNQIQLLPRNLISRLDEYYPQPHDVYDVSLNQDWTLMCCSTYGINHNYLHFYKNEGYNLEYNLISKVQNPHKGPIKILSINNTFITYAQDEKTLRLWSKIRRSKKSIIQKQQEYFVCSGQINYRQKIIKNCSILQEQNLLLINYADEVVLINLKNRQISSIFKTKNQIQSAFLTKKSKNQKNIILVTKQKILSYEINQTKKTLQNSRVIYNFQPQAVNNVSLSINFAGKVALLIKYHSKQCILQYDLNKYSVAEYLQNQDTENGSVLALCYMKNKLLYFGSDASIVNMSSQQQFIKLSESSKSSIHGMETEQDSGYNVSSQTFENVHKSYIQRINTKQKGEVYECLQKIQLQMYPNTAFAFAALCDKMFL